MVNVSVGHIFIMLLPFIGWIVGMKARIPFLVLLSGVLFVALGVYFMATLPVWMVLSFGILGVVLVVGAVMVAW